jgi:hypothetical protein
MAGLTHQRDQEKAWSQVLGIGSGAGSASGRLLCGSKCLASLLACASQSSSCLTLQPWPARASSSTLQAILPSIRGRFPPSHIPRPSFYHCWSLCFCQPASAQVASSGSCLCPRRDLACLLVSRSNGLPGQGGHDKQALIRGSGPSRPGLPSCCYYIDEPGKILSNTRRVSRRQKDLLPGPVVSLCNDTQDKQQHLKIERGSRDCQPRQTELFS